MTIQYHPGKANVMIDALHRKAVSMDILAYMSGTKHLLAKEIQNLESKFMQLGLFERGGLLASIKDKSMFMEEIKFKQFEDGYLDEIISKIVISRSQGTTLDADGVPTTRVDYNVEQMAKIYVKKIMKLQGVPLSIILDYGTLFISKFWRKLNDELGVQLTFSILFHPQTDGQSERIIQVLEDMLRGCVIYF